MDWKRWRHRYYKIISDFGYDPQKDFESASVLNNFLKNKMRSMDSTRLKQMIQGRTVFIYGCGPSLPYHLELLRNSSLPLENFTHIAADGATTALLGIDIIPNIVVTDLDGRISDLVTANKSGAIILIHAHGDNLDAIHQYFDLFPGEIRGTTQNEPLSHVKNYGGFTDGDRCVFLAVEMESTMIILFGFDFGNIIGKFSKPNLKNDELANDTKRKKLQWAQDLISELSMNIKSKIIKINNNKMELGNVKNLNFDDLLKYLKNGFIFSKNSKKY